jgi:hypothetical protein
MIRQTWALLGVSALAAGLAMAGSAGAAPDWTVGPNFSVTVSLSPRAAARLAHPKETIMISADFYGDANAKGQSMQNDGGQIELAPSQKDEIPGAGVAQFHGPRYDKTKLAYVDDGLQVLINVFSGRHSSPDNILDCDFFQDKIAVVAAATIPIHCKLIGE